MAETDTTALVNHSEASNDPAVILVAQTVAGKDDVVDHAPTTTSEETAPAKPPSPSSLPTPSPTPPTTTTVVAPKKFSAVNINKKFLEKNSASLSANATTASGTTTVKAGSPTPVRPANPTSVAVASSRLVTAKLTVAPRSLTSPSSWSRSGVASPGNINSTDGSNGTSPNQTASSQSVQHSIIQPLPRGQAALNLHSSNKPVWRSVKASGSPMVDRNVQNDFPTAAEVAIVKQAKEAEARELAESLALDKQARSVAADTFRGVNLDPNAHHWDEMEEDDDDFLDGVIDFGDGRQYKIPTSAGETPEQPIATEEVETEPVRKQDRFADDFDRSWPRSKPPANEQLQLKDRAPRPLSAASSSSHTHSAHSPQESARVLFNERSNRLEPYATRHTTNGISGISARRGSQSEKALSPTVETNHRADSANGAKPRPKDPWTRNKLPSTSPKVETAGFPAVGATEQSPSVPPQTISSPTAVSEVLSTQAEPPVPPVLSPQDMETAHRVAMQASAERARLRRQQEEEERERNKERARQKAAELEAKAAAAREAAEQEAKAKAAEKITADDPQVSRIIQDAADSSLQPRPARDAAPVRPSVTPAAQSESWRSTASPISPLLSQKERPRVTGTPTLLTKTPSTVPAIVTPPEKDASGSTDGTSAVADSAEDSSKSNVWRRKAAGAPTMGPGFHKPLPPHSLFSTEADEVKSSSNNTSAVDKSDTVVRLPKSNFIREPAMSSLDNAMSRIKGAINKIQTTEAATEAPVSVAAPWKPHRTDDSDPREVFDVTRTERPTSPKPAWDKWVVSLPKVSRKAERLSKKQHQLMRVPTPRLGFAVLSFVPPVEAMKLSTLSVTDVLFLIPPPQAKVKLKIIVSLPSASSKHLSLSRPNFNNTGKVNGTALKSPADELSSWRRTPAVVQLSGASLPAKSHASGKSVGVIGDQLEHKDVQAKPNTGEDSGSALAFKSQPTSPLPTLQDDVDSKSISASNHTRNIPPWTPPAPNYLSKDSPARHPDPEHLKAVWSQGPESVPNDKGINSLESIGDDLTALPFTLQEMKSEDGETPPTTTSAATAPPSRMSLHDVTRAFQQVPAVSPNAQSTAPLPSPPAATNGTTVRPPTFAYTVPPNQPGQPRMAYVPYPQGMMASPSPTIMYAQPAQGAGVGGRGGPMNGHIAVYPQPMWMAMSPAGAAGQGRGAQMMRPVPYPTMAYANPHQAMYGQQPVGQPQVMGRGTPMLSPALGHAAPQMYHGSPVMMHASPGHPYVPMAMGRGQARTDQTAPAYAPAVGDSVTPAGYGNLYAPQRW